MAKLKWGFTVCAMFLAALLTTGCSQKAKEPARIAANSKSHDHEHDHATVGPHGGDLIELGSDQFHAELVHDEMSVAVYIFGADAKSANPIDASELTINLKHDGKAEQFKLVASPDTSDTKGKSSRFVSNDAELGEYLDHEGAEPQLVVMIDGKQYRGRIEHGEHGPESNHKH